MAADIAFVHSGRQRNEKKRERKSKSWHDVEMTEVELRRRFRFSKANILFILRLIKDTTYRYNHVPHLTQDTNGKVTNSQLDTTNESQEVSPFPTGDDKAHINRRAQRHRKHKTEKQKRSIKEVTPWNNQ